MSEAALLKGYLCLVLRTHAVELHDIDDSLAVQFMHDVQRLSRAVRHATNPRKMNYEIHGNSIPHLHMHFYTRIAGDRFEGGPIDPRVVDESPYGPGEFEETKGRIIHWLSEPADRMWPGVEG